MTKEKLQHHLEHLREKHAKLDQEVDHMEATGHFTDDQLHVLKKKRLVLRDEIEEVIQKIKKFED